MTSLRAEIGVPEDHRCVELDGVRIAYDDRGRGPAVVCLHATGHGAPYFEPFRERVGDRCRVVTFDWPGQRRSGEDKMSACGQRYVHLLELFLEHRNLEGVILLGNAIQ